MHTQGQGTSHLIDTTSFSGTTNFGLSVVNSCLKMPVPASSTSVGGSRSPSSKQVSARGASGSGQVRQRKSASTAGRTSRSVAGGGTGASGGGMWRFYTEDSPGLKVGPVPVLVMSLIFIASVFMLHIWGKYTRG